MSELVRVFKALGDDTRIRILKLLQEKDCCVCELTEVLGLAQSTVSGQLRVLKDAGLVEDRRSGAWVDYCIHRGAAGAYGPRLLELLSSWIEDDPLVKADRRKARTVSRETVCRR